MKKLALFAAAGLAASVSHAQLVVGNDQSGVATIWHIDVNTGVATGIYSASDSSAKPWGMAYDPDTNTLYWNSGGTLFSSPFDINGLSPTNLGTLTFNGSNVNFVGLGFRNGVLVGTRNISVEATYEIDVNTLQATQIWAYPSTFDFGGLDVDATTGILYGLSDTPSTARGLYEIDDAAQTTTFISGYPAGETDIDGLAVHNGIAYYVSDGPNTTQSEFYVVDIASGSQTGTLPSPFTGSGTFSAAAYIAAGGPPECLGDIADDFGFTADEGGGPDGQVDFGDFVALLGLIGPCP